MIAFASNAEFGMQRAVEGTGLTHRWAGTGTKTPNQPEDSNQHEEDSVGSILCPQCHHKEPRADHLDFCLSTCERVSAVS